MSSGSRTSPGLGFCNTGAPRADVPACPAARYEPRGPRLLLAGLCHLCGRATTRTGPAGVPEHEQIPWLIA